MEQKTEGGGGRGGEHISWGTRGQFMAWENERVDVKAKQHKNIYSVARYYRQMHAVQEFVIRVFAKFFNDGRWTRVDDDGGSKARRHEECDFPKTYSGIGAGGGASRLCHSEE